MAKIPGYKMLLKIADKTVVGYRSNSMDIEAYMGNATTGESTDQWKEYLPLFKGAEFSVEGLYDPTAGSNSSADDIIALLIAGTQVTVKYGRTEVGATYYTVPAYIRHVHVEGPYDDLSSYTIDLVSDGEVTDEVVPTP